MSLSHTIARAQILARNGDTLRAIRLLRDALKAARSEDTREEIETAIAALAA